MKHMKWQWVVKGIFFGALFIIVFVGVTMFLWNSLLPEIFGLPVISFGQALGLMVLGRLLTGGFKPGGGFRGGPGSHMRRRHMQERWKNMSEEERQKFSERWSRFGCGPDIPAEPTTKADSDQA